MRFKQQLVLWLMLCLSIRCVAIHERPGVGDSSAVERETTDAPVSPDETVSDDTLPPAPAAADDSAAAENTVRYESVGRVTIEYLDDFAGETATVLYWFTELETDTLLSLAFVDPEDAAALSPEHVYRLRGGLTGQQLTVDEAGVFEESALIPFAAAPKPSLGEQKVLVMVATFNDGGEPNCSTADLERMLFSDPGHRSADDYYREVSWGALSLSGRVVGPYAIDASTDSCSTAEWERALDELAAADGVQLSDYSRKLYVVPKDVACNFGGRATTGFGGASTRAVIVNCVSSTLIHELGHNFGWQHAITEQNPRYGDRSCIMGGDFVQPNAPHREQFGWTNSDRIRVVSTPGTYELAPLELASTATTFTQILKIPGNGGYYYLSHRQRLDWDNVLGREFIDTLSVHFMKANNHGTTLLVGAFPTNLSHSLANTDLRVTLRAATSEKLSVQIEELPSEQDKCVRSHSTLLVSPTVQSVAPGGTASYTFTVQSHGCSQEEIYLRLSQPEGFQSKLSVPKVTLAPDQKATFTLSTTAPATASGRYDFRVKTTVNPAKSTVDSAVNFRLLVSPSVDAAEEPPPPLDECASKPPVVTLTPSEREVKAGQSANYTVSVRNQSCQRQRITLSSSAPAGLRIRVGTPEATMPVGGAITGTVTVSSATTLAPGAYSFSLIAKTPNINVTKVGRYIVLP